MIIEKKIYYKIDDDDVMQVYDSFSCYCVINDIEENYTNFLKFFTDECIEYMFYVDYEGYENIDSEDTRFLFYKEMMGKYNKDYILIQRLENRKKKLENEYQKLENEYKKLEHQIEQIKHKYDL